MLRSRALGAEVTFKIVVALGVALFACSATPDDPSGSGGKATGGSAGAPAAGSGTGGSTTNTGGSGSGGAAAGGAGGGSGGSSSGSSSGGANGGGAGSGGTGGTGGGSNDDCTPKPAGTFVVTGDVVFDEKTCLTWMKTNTSGDPYAAAETYCAGLTLGGYDDWRLPTAGEIVSIFKCDGMYPPTFDVFTVMGDGIWTTTLSGTIAGDEPKVCGAGQASGQYYDFGKVGGQNTRCVRGPMTLPDRTDCKTNNQICAN